MGDVNIGVLTAVMRLKDELSGQLNGVISTAKKTAGVLAATFAGIDFGGAAKKAVAEASKIADAAQRMGIGAEAVQRLAFAAKQGGASLESVSTAMGQMANVLGGEGGAKALANVGLSFEQIKGLTPDQTFIAIADAVAQIEDPLKRADAARDLFGRGALELLPAIQAGFKDVGDQAPIMSAAIIASADESGDKLEKMETQLANLKARALLPLVDMFTSMPSAVQTGIGAILEFSPSLETLTLAVVAAGGPKAALTALATLFTTTLPGAIAGFVSGAGAAILTFFTTTLPAAFASTIAFLGPQGLIALALIALGLVWYKWGDDITAIVKKLYTAVKTWLVDKFSDIVAGVKAKIDAVKGFFADMYDKVVGNSWVPDMIREIGAEFDTLDQRMVKPTDMATSLVQSAFRSMSDNVQSTVSRMLSQLSSLLTDWLDKFMPSWAARLLGSVADTLIGGLVGKIPGMGSSGGGGILSAAGGLIPGLLGGGGGPVAGTAVGGTVFGGGLPGAGGGALGFLANPAFWTNPWTIGIGAAIGGGLLLTKLFGGPSEQEKEGREAAAQFRGGLEAGLTDRQRNEAAGINGILEDNERWKLSVIAIRDAYLAVGRSEQDALSAADRLFRAEKGGADAVQRVADEITHAMQNAPAPMTGWFAAQYSGESVPPPAYYENGEDDGGDFFHNGGFVKAHAGMYVRRRRGLAPGEVNITALEGEGILNRRATAAIGGEAGVNALNRGGRVGEPTIQVNGPITVVANSPAEFARQLKTVLRRDYDEALTETKILVTGRA